MQGQQWIASIIARRAFGLLTVVVLAALLPAPARAQYWTSYGRDAQHDGLAVGPSQYPQAIKWSTPVDMDPQYSNGDSGALYTHYGSPVITSKNTVLVPVKLQAGGSFQVSAFVGGTGKKIWSFATDYVLPSHDWIPPMGVTLTAGGAAVAIPGAGGSVWLRSSPDSANGTSTRVSFVSLTSYAQSPALFNNAIQISTPITCDSAGNLYFGYLSSGAALPGYPNGIPSGLARISSTGVGTYVAATSLCGDPSIQKVVYNCAPALSADGTSVYVAVNSSEFSSGYLCQASSATLSPMNHVALADPSGGHAVTSDDGTASPTVGPDGDVYFGVLENGWPTAHHDRGWLLHFNSTLTTTKIPGSFGWDDSATVVPSKLVPSYAGTSSYLVLTKYNDYSDPGIGGTGQNKVAVLDPNATESDPIIPNVLVMKEILTVVGPTPNPSGIPGVCEWCINSAAVDEINKCAIVNSEDGHVYRWSFTTNTLSPGVSLAPPTGEAYTSTAIGPDGAVYAINNARIFSVVAAPHAQTEFFRRGSDVFDLAGDSRPGGPILTLLIPIALLAAALIALASEASVWLARRPHPFSSRYGSPALILIERNR
jgi:hypothetical protein